jgi:uncharacterized protein YegP (UPF0339 family)
MKFVIRKSSDKQWYFILKARNGEIIATSETYKTKQACKKGIRSVKRTSFLTNVIDLT